MSAQLIGPVDLADLILEANQVFGFWQMSSTCPHYLVEAGDTATAEQADDRAANGNLQPLLRAIIWSGDFEALRLGATEQRSAQ